MRLLLPIAFVLLSPVAASSDPLDALLCETTIDTTIPAPNGDSMVVIFDVDCGATTPFNTQVSIAPADRAFSAGEFPPVFVVDGRHTLAVSWIDDSAIEIHVPAGEQIYRKEGSTGGVSVTYR